MLIDRLSLLSGGTSVQMLCWFLSWVMFLFIIELLEVFI